MTSNKEEVRDKKEVREIILKSLNNFFENQIVHNTTISRQLLAKDIEENLNKENKIIKYED